MKKISLIIIFLSFSINASIGPTIGRSLINVASFTMYNIHTALSIGFTILGEKYFFHNISAQHCALNKRPETKEIIDSVLAQYSPHNKNIQFYADIGGEPYNNLFAFKNWIFLDSSNYQNLLQDKNSPEYLSTIAKLGHEIGHVNNNDHQSKLIDMTGTSILTFAGLLQLKRIPAFQWKQKSGITKFGIALCALPLKIIIDQKAWVINQNYREKAADEYVIKHTDDPRVLSAMADFFANQDPLEEKYHESFFDTHPSEAKRARHFLKAARNLRRNQNKVI